MTTINIHLTFDILTFDCKQLTVINVLGRVVRKPVNVHPRLKVIRGNNFSPIKILSTAYVLRSLILIMLKTEGQKI